MALFTYGTSYISQFLNCEVVADWSPPIPLSTRRNQQRSAYLWPLSRGTRLHVYGTLEVYSRAAIYLYCCCLPWRICQCLLEFGTWFVIGNHEEGKVEEHFLVSAFMQVKAEISRKIALGVIKCLDPPPPALNATASFLLPCSITSINFLLRSQGWVYIFDIPPLYLEPKFKLNSCLALRKSSTPATLSTHDRESRLTLIIAAFPRSQFYGTARAFF